VAGFQYVAVAVPCRVGSVYESEQQRQGVLQVAQSNGREGAQRFGSDSDFVKLSRQASVRLL
jgi:hypothetical protein